MNVSYPSMRRKNVKGLSLSKNPELGEMVFTPRGVKISEKFENFEKSGVAFVSTPQEVKR